MSNTWISLCDVDVEETMDRKEAIELAINALDRDERFHERAGRYSSATDASTARTILERMRDEIEEQA